MVKEVNRPIGITSPLTTGDDVEAAQRELKERGWLEGPIDGQFGPDSHRATKKAQYYMGFSLRAITGRYNPYLHEILIGTRKLRADQEERRKERLEKVATNVRPKREKLADEMAALVGKLVEVPPNSNRVKGVTDWYGIVGPWCAMVTTKCGVKVQLVAFKKAERWAYCPYILNAAREGRDGVRITYNPVRGTVVLYDWDNDGIADHVGVFDRWVDKAAGTFYCYEGNTSHTNRSNGGNQEHNIRSKSDVIAFVHCFE